MTFAADAVGYGERTGMRLDMVTGRTIFNSARWLSMRNVGVESRFLGACGDLVKFDDGQFMRSRHRSALTYRRTSFKAKVGIGATTYLRSISKRISRQFRPA